MRLKKGAIRGRTIKLVLMQVGLAHNLEVAVFKVCILHVNLINIRVSLVRLFMWYFRLLMEICRIIVIILARVVASLREGHLLGFLAEVVILGQLDLLVIV